MEKTEKFFIFTWKELMVIVLLVLTLVGFFFTLGLHYGKQIALPTHHSGTSEIADKTEEGPENVPPKENLEASSNHSKAVVENTIKHETESEVEHSGIKIEQPKAVALPTEKAAHHPEQHAEQHAEHKAVTHEEEKTAEEPAPVVATSGAFFIQLGSYTTKKEAQARIKAYSKVGVRTEIQTAEVNHVTRYRVVIPGFKSKPAADQHGRELKQKHKIENYIVIK